ncbi:NifU family protein [Listeria fleischmannii 1991]|jgi:Fe-S cluster biogenesis protein NfuA|uniref:Fe/S biogenesis protein NfuA n=3 Tax=Listeria fleischmannii TaxID=1069827 RepID=A0A2X3GT85_9LIST|nr:NifU family protein [Listeria fleischmannii]EMG27952.1 NifU family protein [Listeria fleischmannii subsp. fleischmannii LU2006-1]KMT61345.1 NifU family protein [Listeria fleischmannii 1991]MBC1398585.1 NifU family protein [Listeria fleischmannii]MBC1419975.1 NifU family protein [Listeria fleischmannii]MBC1426646.1 NifU family protein [Listeria fleischmannii]
MEEISFDSVDKALQKFRPYLLRDGGDYELIDVTQDGIVKIRLLGACVTCPSSDMTLKMGIELTLSEKIFGFKEVVQVF